MVWWTYGAHSDYCTRFQMSYEFGGFATSYAYSAAFPILYSTAVATGVNDIQVLEFLERCVSDFVVYFCHN